MKRLKVIPLLIFTAMLAFSVRLADIVVTGVPDFSGAVYAAAEPSQDALAAPKEDAPKEETKAEEKEADKKEEKKSSLKIIDDVNKKEEKTDEAKKEEIDPKDKEAGAFPASEWKDASDSDLEFTDVKMEMFADLTKRREQLDKREASLVTKEALLKATEQELDRKYQELDTLRTELKKLLDQQETEDTAQITSLVKVYEGMKPKDAARIFDTLDQDVLIAVVSKMSERKLSPILAEMNSERAKTVTTLLAEQKQLPPAPAEELIPQSN